MTSTATLATKALRTIWPKPTTLRTTQNDHGDLEVTAGRGVRMQAAGAAHTLSSALGTKWELVEIAALRGSSNIRITYRLATQQTKDAAAGETEGEADEKTVTADVDAAITTIAKMRAVLAEAKAAEQKVLGTTMPGTFERNRVYQARLQLTRAELTLAYLLGDRRARLVTVEASYDEGKTWETFSAHASEFRPPETASEHALRHAVEQRYAGSNRWRSTDHPLRVRVYTDPQSLSPDGEWTNFTDPCPTGQHDLDGNHVHNSGRRRTDGSTVETARCSRCGHSLWRVRPFDGEAAESVWQLEGEPLPDVEPGVACLPVVCIQTRHYGMQINDGCHGWQKLIAVGPIDPGTGTVTVYTNRASDGEPTGQPDPRDRDLLKAAYNGQLGWDRRPNGHQFSYINGPLASQPVNADDSTRIDRLVADGFLTYRTAHSFSCVETLAPAWPFLPYQRNADALVLLRPHDEGPGPDGTPTQTPDPDPGPDPAGQPEGSWSGPARPVPLRYRVRTQTADRVRIVQTGTIPPIWPGVRTGLEEAARTILGNARPILGLDPREPMPAVTVQTWDLQSGLTTTVTRN